MKKAFDQTVRDLKRGVNKKVLKVPSIEQKVRDATSNEPWGPHGTLVADIAQASRNDHEFQMIMSILWKRMNDTGKNWRHVYKAMTVLEYMVAHGSERVVDELREHAYQIKTLAEFQYIDSSGRDQGNNVRKKSQNLVLLVNDKERIHEVRQKAAASREKFQNKLAGNIYQSRSLSTGGRGERYDGRYGSRTEELYGRGRKSSYRDDDSYGDSYSRDDDRYSREYDDQYGRDDDSRGRSNVNGSQYGSRSRSSNKDGDRVLEDDGKYSSRESGSREEEQPQGRSAPGHNIYRSYSEQNLGAPPSCEAGVTKTVESTRSPNHSDRDREISAAASKSYSPSASSSPAQVTDTSATVNTPLSSAAPALSGKEADVSDPRGSFPATSTTSNGIATTMSCNGEIDLFASVTDNSLALVPITPLSSTNEVDTSTNVSSEAPNRGFDDPFGDGPFKAIPSTDGMPGPQQSFHSLPSFQNSSNSGLEPHQQVSQSSAVMTFPDTTSTSSRDHNIDIMADLLSLSGHQHPVSLQPDHPLPHTSFSESAPSTNQNSSPAQSGHPSSHNGFLAQSGQLPMQPNFSTLFGQPAAGFSAHNGQFSSLTAYPNQSAQASLSGFSAQTGQPASVGFTSPEPNGHYVQPYAGPSGNYNMQSGGQNMVPEISSAATSQSNSTNFLVTPQPFQAPHAGSNALVASQSGSPSTALISSAPPAKDKFETKSTLWTDTLSRGLVNLDISGPKTNPLSDIGVDFDSLNRKEKRMEKPSTAPVISTVHMGKAMGSGSGIGLAGAGVQRPTSNPMMGAGAGMRMDMADPRPGASMAFYGGMNQQPMGGGMGMNMPQNMGMGSQMQRPMGFPPGSTIPLGYNPIMGTANYGYNPYGGGYR